MFAIYVSNKDKYFMKDHKKVILFEDEQTARAAVSAFFDWAIPQAMMLSDFRDMRLLNDVIETQNFIEIKPLPADCKLETVNFKDLKK